MSNLITETVLSLWKTGRKTKETPAGWISGNAVCCHHRGEKEDKRGRGGLLISNEGFNYSCFNCNFKTGWLPGKSLSERARLFLSWLNLSDNEIQNLSLFAIKNKEEQNIAKHLNFELEVRDLPMNCKKIEEWILEGCEDPSLIAVIDYILSRGMKIEWYQWMWSNSTLFKDRVIIPFYQKDINGTVGWIARKISDGSPKYLKSAQPGYVFNLDRQTYDRKYVIVVEGHFDAIGIDGVAAMGNHLNETQISRINSLNREVIIVPDNDHAGINLIDIANGQNWSVSLPDWGDGIKDVADAVKKYGRTYTLYTILKYREHGQIRLNLLKKRIENNAIKK